MARNRSLVGRNLIGCDLAGQDFTGYDFTGANLVGANLVGANLAGVNLYKAVLGNSFYNKCLTGMVVEEEMFGYVLLHNGDVVKIKIPVGAVVFVKGYDNKREAAIFRTNIATVVKYEKHRREKFCITGDTYSYEVGGVLTVKNYNCQYNARGVEANGIEFYRNKCVLVGGVSGVDNERKIM